MAYIDFIMESVLGEGRTELLPAKDWAGRNMDLRVYWNPSAAQLDTLFQTSNDEWARGLIVGDDVVLWDAYRCEHTDGAAALGIELPDNRTGRFFIHKYSENDHRIGPGRMLGELVKNRTITRLVSTRRYRVGGPEEPVIIL